MPPLVKCRLHRATMATMPELASRPPRLYVGRDPCEQLKPFQYRGIVLAAHVAACFDSHGLRPPVNRGTTVVRVRYCAGNLVTDTTANKNARLRTDLIRGMLRTAANDAVAISSKQHLRSTLRTQKLPRHFETII